MNHFISISMRRASISASLAFVLCVTAFAAVAHAQDGARTASSEPAAKTKVRIATIERRPFAMRAGDGFTGFSIELWQQIAEKLSLETEFVETKAFSEMLTLVSEGKVDGAIANITITSEREKTMDFTQPMFDAGLQVMVRSEGVRSGLFGAVFNLEMLGLVALAGLLLFGAANLMWWFERRDQPYFQYPYGESVWRSFWWALNVILNGGFEERVPQTTMGRIFATFLVIASLFIVSAFVAKITAALTVGQLTSQIQGYRDLYGRRVGTTAGSTSATFLDTHSVAFRAYKNTEELFAALERKELDAIVHDAPILAYYANTKGRGRVTTVGAMLRPEKFGIALNTGSPHREGINRALLRLREDGSFAELKRKWFGVNY